MMLASVALEVHAADSHGDGRRLFAARWRWPSCSWCSTSGCAARARRRRCSSPKAASGMRRSTSTTPWASTAFRWQCSCCRPSSSSPGTFASWQMKTDVKAYFLWFCLLSVGVFGFFISVDLFTMFMFYEVALIPMYLLIGVWGSGRQGVRRDETDADAHGRFGVAAGRHPGHLLPVRPRRPRR